MSEDVQASRLAGAGEGTEEAEAREAAAGTEAGTVLARVASPAVSGVDGAVLGRRNDRLLLILLGGYVTVLTVLMITRGVSITPDVLLVGLALVAVILGRGRLFLRDWIPFIGLFFAYELMRGYADNFGADVHVTDVLALERWLFLSYLPTQVLQEWLRPASGTDLVAVAATLFYFLHFPLPIAVAFFLWLRRRRWFYDYVAGVIVLSMAAFVTYLLLPVAPPWYAADAGVIPGPDGRPAIAYLKEQGFTDLAGFFGFEGRYLYSYTMYDINPNQVAAFPSLHAAYPFLAFLFARRTFGGVGWLMLVYAAAVWFSIVYLADHYVVDILGGLFYAGAAYWFVVHSPGRFRRLMDAATDERLEAPDEDADVPDGRSTRWLRPGWRPRGETRWPVVRQGLLIATIGLVAAAVLVRTDFLGGSGSPLFLVPAFTFIGGLWRAATGLLTR